MSGASRKVFFFPPNLALALGPMVKASCGDQLQIPAALCTDSKLPQLLEITFRHTLRRALPQPCIRGERWAGQSATSEAWRNVRVQGWAAEGKSSSGPLGHGSVCQSDKQSGGPRLEGTLDTKRSPLPSPRALPLKSLSSRCKGVFKSSWEMHIMKKTMPTS